MNYHTHKNCTVAYNRALNTMPQYTEHKYPSLYEIESRQLKHSQKQLIKTHKTMKTTSYNHATINATIDAIIAERDRLNQQLSTLRGLNKSLESMNNKARKTRKTTRRINVINVAPDAPVFVAEYISLTEKMKAGEVVSEIQTDKNGKQRIVSTKYVPKAKSWVAYGEGTKNHINDLKNMGARFCRALNIDGKQTAGWIVPFNRLKSIDELKNTLGVK